MQAQLGLRWSRMEAKILFTLALIAGVLLSGADGAVTCETCSSSSPMVYYVTVYRQGTRYTCIGQWLRQRCGQAVYFTTSSIEARTRTVTSTYDCRCTTIPEPVQPTATSTSSSTATGTIPPSISLSRTVDASSRSGTATRTKPPVNSVTGTADAASPTVSPAASPLDGSRVQLGGADVGSIAGTIIICLIVVIVVVAIIVVVVLGVYKYRTRSTKSSADSERF